MQFFSAILSYVLGYRPARRFAAVWVALLCCCRVGAQVADGSTGVSVAIKLVGLTWAGGSGNHVDVTVAALNGTQASDAGAQNTETPQVMARLAVGKTYNLLLSASGLNNLTVLAVPPAGYVMEIERVPREEFATPFVPSVRLRVRPPLDAAPSRAGVATALGTERTLWQVSLGALSNGESAGTISFIDVGAPVNVASIFSPSGLLYDSPSSEVQVIENSSNAVAPYIAGTLRQIIAPQVCVDIYMDATNQCQLKFYSRAQLGTQSGGIYSFTGDPFSWYFFNQEGQQPNAVRITCGLRNTTGFDSSGQMIVLPPLQPVVRAKVTDLVRTGDAPNHTWAARDWYPEHPESGSTVSLSLRTRNGAAESLAVASESIDSESPPTIVAQLTRTYSRKTWGDEVGTETLGTTDPVVTSYGYWESVAVQSAAYTRVRSQIRHGAWEAYEYYDYADGLATAGALRRRHRPFNSTDTTVPDLANHNGEITTYEWMTDAFGRATRPALVETKVAGVTTAKARVEYSEASSNFSGHTALTLVTATRKDYSASATYLTSITKYFSENAGVVGIATDDFFRSRVHSVQRSDGVKQSYAYQRGTWNGSTFTRSGNGGLDVPSGAFASRISVITGSGLSTAGTLYDTHDGYDIDDVYLVYDTSNSDPTKHTFKSTMQVTIRDNFARVVRTESYVRSGNSWELIGAVNYGWNFSNQLIKRATNESTTYSLTAGSVYDANYDGEYLVSETNESGVVVGYTYDTAGRVETVTKDGFGATTSLATKFTYDAASRVKEQRVGWGQTEQLVTSRVFDLAGRIQSESSPGPNGPITATYSYVPASRQTTVSLPLGRNRTEIQHADGGLQEITGTAVVPEYFNRQILSDGARYARVNLGTTNSARLNESWSDWLGRTTQTSRPGFTGQGALVEAFSFYDTSGRIKNSTRKVNDTPVYAATLYKYDELGQLIRSCLDLNNNNTPEPDGSNRVGDNDQYFEKIAGEWWLTKIGKTYPKTGDNTPLRVSTTRQRLTGFTGSFRSETVAIDVDNVTTTRTVAIDRPGKTTTVSTTRTGFQYAQTETYVNGLATRVERFDRLTYNTGYDSLQRPTTSSDPRTGLTTTSYKSGSTFVDWVRDAAGNTVATYTYDAAARVVAVTDAANKVERTEYNTRDQVIRRWGDTVHPAEYGYSDFGERTSLKTFRAGSNWNLGVWPSNTGSADQTTWNYDPPSGLLTSKTYPAADPASSDPSLNTPKTVSYTYNARGQTATRTWARGIVTTYNYYDLTGELHTQTYSDGTTPTVTYTYTRAGQIDSVNDGVTGARNFAYNADQPVQLDAVAHGGFYADRVLTRQYDGLKRPNGFLLGTGGSAASLSADLTQTHTYNALGRFESLVSARGTQTGRSFSYDYNGGGLVSAMNVVGSSLAVSREYEPNRDLLTKIDTLWSGVSRTRYDYTYNALGQRATGQQTGDAFTASSDLGGSTYYRYNYWFSRFLSGKDSGRAGRLGG